jgi:tRNA(Ile)-lysidine synthase
LLKMSHSPISIAEAERLLEPLARFAQVALAVSGGPDSLALMHLASNCSAARGRSPKLSVLTVDHGLRPGSREEAETVARMATSLGLPHAILTWEAESAPSASLQARARAARYDLMAAYCHAHDIPALVTAHHLDDQAETFLMRLKRGSGLDGLAAIPAAGAWSGITLLRPLLDVPKARLIATLLDAGIGFVSDPSNADPRFERTRVRGSGEALKMLGLTPEALALSARRLGRAREALDHAAARFIADHGAMNQAGYCLLNCEALASAPPEIALRALSCVIAAVGGGEEPIRLAKLEALLAALAEDPGKTHTLGRCRLEPSRGRLGIFRELRGKGLPAVRVAPGERTLWDNRFRIELGERERAPIVVKALGEAGLRELRQRSDFAVSLPRSAGRALPSCWRGDTLIGVPALGGARPSGEQGKLDCRAIFINERLGS